MTLRETCTAIAQNIENESFELQEAEKFAIINIRTAEAIRRYLLERMDVELKINRTDDEAPDFLSSLIKDVQTEIINMVDGYDEVRKIVLGVS